MCNTLISIKPNPQYADLNSHNLVVRHTIFERSSKTSQFLMTSINIIIILEALNKLFIRHLNFY